MTPWSIGVGVRPPEATGPTSLAKPTSSAGQTATRNRPAHTHCRSGRADVATDYERIYGYFPRLAERRRQQAGTLSGGEQQMLAVSRALMLRPRLLLLDEPSFGLAPLIVQELFEILRDDQRRASGVSMLLVEQNAAMALELADHAYLLETGRVVIVGHRAEAHARRRVVRRVLSRLLRATAMDSFLHQVLAGLATGGIYASLALALVMIYQATHLVNFAQGEMAMFSTYIAWALISAGVPYWARLLPDGRRRVRRRASLIERVVMRPVENAPVLAVVDRLHRPAGDLQQRRRLDLHLHDQAVPEPVPGAAAVRQRYMSPHELGVDRRHAGRAARCCSRSSASRRSAWRCARRRRTRTRAAWSASASAGCWRSAGAWPRRSARSPG